MRVFIIVFMIPFLSLFATTGRRNDWSVYRRSNDVKHIEVPDFNKQVKAQAELEEKVKEPLVEVEKREVPERNPLDSITGTPFGEETGIIVSVKSIPIRGFPHISQASILPKTEGYELFFLDEKTRKIGYVALNTEFKQEKEEAFLLPIAAPVHDFCVIQEGNHLYISYSIQKFGRQQRYLARLDGDTHALQEVSEVVAPFLMNQKKIVPFFTEEGVCFECSIVPRKLAYFEGEKLQLVNVPFSTSFQKLIWEEQWGTLEPTINAQEIGGEYLSFFQSKMVQSDQSFSLVFGAYMFKKARNFEITRISPYPICFKGMGKVVPCSFVRGEERGRKLIYLICVENGKRVEVITFDEEALLGQLNVVNA